MITALLSAIQVFRRPRSSAERSGTAKKMTMGVATPSDAMRVKTIQAMACSSAGMPVCAIAAAPATINSRFFGLSTESATPAPAAFRGRTSRARPSISG